MLTLAQVLRKARKQGAKCSVRTFWNYYDRGLLPRGRKIRGKGNRLFFPDETPERLVLVCILASHWPLRLIAKLNFKKFPTLKTAADELSRMQIKEVVQHLLKR